MRSYTFKILAALSIILLFISILSCISEIIVESVPAEFPYNCIGENPSNSHIAELGRRAALRKDPKMSGWTKGFCNLNKTQEEWIVTFFRKDEIPDDVHEVHGGEMIEVRISANELRIKSISSNIRYER